MSHTDAINEHLFAAGLTERERIVFRELATGDTLDEIAKRLYVTRNTVKTQVRAAYRKLGIGTRSEVRAWIDGHQRPGAGTTV